MRSSTSRSVKGRRARASFTKSLSAAIPCRLPVLFLIEDNGYAISVPSRDQTPTGSISRLLAELPGLAIMEMDGIDPIGCYKDLAAAIQSLRAGGGPVLAHACVVRLQPHSNSDDHSAYRTEGEIEATLQ